MGNVALFSAVTLNLDLMTYIIAYELDLVYSLKTYPRPQTKTGLSMSRFSELLYITYTQTHIHVRTHTRADTCYRNYYHIPLHEQ